MRAWRVLMVAIVVLVCPRAAHADVVWLCNPSFAASDDPCQTPLDTTVIAPDGSTTTQNPARLPAARRPVDCFYVYPTVSNQPTVNANKDKDPEVRAVAKFQASRFSPGCRMFAPMYREATVAGVLGNVLPPTAELAYSDVVEAWKSYLANDNHGRGVVLIGHSQGSLMLRALIHREIDPNPAERAKLVGAVLLGGNVTTKAGSAVGGDFANVPVCTKRGEDGCVVAYSTSSTDPEAVSFFGNTNTDALGVAFGLPSGPGYEVACTDPGPLSGRTGPFGITVPTEPYPPGFIAGAIAATANGDFPAAPTTWVTDFRYTGGCKTINGAHVLRYDPVGDSRHLNEFPPTWGTHLVDFNLGFGRLTSIARQQAHTWLASGFKVTRRSAFVPGAGTVTVRGRGLKRRVVRVTAPGRVRLRVVRKQGAHPAHARVIYRPGATGIIRRSLALRL